MSNYLRIWGTKIVFQASSDMQVFCMCPSGFLLGPDWKQCEDVDECLKVSSAMAGPKLC